jgi:hypothetical protein
MAQVTYTGERPVLTPTLAQDGEGALGAWQPGESKDVPLAFVDGLTGEGSAFSAGTDGSVGSAPSSPEKEEG